MRILDICVTLTMISPVFSVIIIILGMSSKNKRIKNICLSIGIIIPSIFMTILFGVAIPYAFFKSIFINFWFLVDSNINY